MVHVLDFRFRPEAAGRGFLYIMLASDLKESFGEAYSRNHLFYSPNMAL